MNRLEIHLTVNGHPQDLVTRPNRTLLEVLREDLGLTGAKDACGGEGECGACTVLLDGRVVNSCLIPAIQAQGSDLVTVEGLAEGERLSGLQDAFLTHNGAQCGFCTPGMLLSAQDLLRRHPHPTDGEIKEGLAGNLCRCTGYVKILDAVKAAAKGDGK
jgi:carbon-monoxide dehydrogenase small subunit